MAKSKHVIFLGAGASATSGYPLGEGLRKEWLCGAQAILQKIDSSLHNPDHPSARNIFAQRAKKPLRNWLSNHADALQLFRKGCFGSIDEFCYHVRASRPKDVAKLKDVLRLVFAVHEPESKFTTSDYYSFVQKLFLAENLAKLRDDITVISFNYDPYLEFLLQRSLITRLKALDQKPEEHLSTLGRINSGFMRSPEGPGGLSDNPSFAVLKLHGTVAWSDINKADMPGEITYTDFFSSGINERLLRLCTDAAAETTPIIFPWEAFDGKSADFANAERFVLGAEGLHDIYEAIWYAAKQAVESATRISFVGLSMHPYLGNCFKNVFQSRKQVTEWGITDAKSYAQNRIADASPTNRAHQLLSSAGVHIPLSPSIYRDFADFIEHGMREPL